jgi:ABC-2 type transport system permease protein
MLSVLVLSAEIAALINDQSQTQQAVIPAIIWVFIGYVISLMLNTALTQSSSVLVKILTLFVMVLPGIGQIGIPEMIVSDSISYPFAIVGLFLGIIGSLFIIKLTAKKYATNVLSYNRNTNIIVQWIKTGI